MLIIIYSYTKAIFAFKTSYVSKVHA